MSKDQNSNTEGLNGIPKGSQTAVKFDPIAYNQFLLDYMRNLYPDIPAYQNGQLLYAPISIDTSPATAGETNETNNVYQILTNQKETNYSAQGFIKLKQHEIKNIAPQVEEEIIEDLLDDSFDFFVEDEVEEEVVEVPEPENDVFIATYSTELSDCHALYLQQGPHTGIDRNTFSVLYIDQGVARAIPNYQTLEVMLVERQIGYESIRLITDEEISLYGVYSIVNNGFGEDEGGPLESVEQYERYRMPDRASEWNYNIRFKSGYRPVLPYLRDPGDYYLAGETNDIGEPYNMIVYEEQTAKEKMRDKYEGKMVVYNVTYDKVDDVPNTVVDADINSVRIMTYGYWKLPIELETYRAYNEFNEIGATPPTENEHINWLERFNRAGFLTPFQGGEGGFVSGWNDFPHIAGFNTLDVAEYTEYYDSTGGDVFELEYLEPYEPRGSVKYYTAEVNEQLRQEAIQDLEALQEEAQQQEQLNRLVELLDEDLQDLKQKINAAQTAINTTFTEYSGVDAIRKRAAVIGRDLQLFWHNNYQQNGEWGYYRSRRNRDRKKGSNRGLFQLINDEMRNSHEKIVMEGYLLSQGDVDCQYPSDNTPDTRGCGLMAGTVSSRADFDRRFRDAADTVADITTDYLGTLMPSYGGMIPGGGGYGNIFQDLKNKINNIANSIGNFFRDLAAAFSKFGVSGTYGRRADIHAQISAFGINAEKWGDGSSQVRNITLNDWQNPRYYDSPIFGSYLTPFDESIENLIGSEEFAVDRSNLINTFDDLFSQATNLLQDLRLPGTAISQQQFEEVQAGYDSLLAEFNNSTTAISINSLDTMHSALDFVAKMWIAKSHNTANVMRKNFRQQRDKWFIRYNPNSARIVRKYFPNAGADHFGDKSYKKIALSDILGAGE
tara:strand:+ start:7242 stop:9920 length:2679 start_codon:yes stop_codon:yes gene_type:complete